jgi:Mg2+ and Co2+ transporter CorA
MLLRYRWKSRPDVGQLEQTIDQLRTELIQLRREVSNKEQYIGRLKILCHERTTRIDDQRGRIEQLQERNQQLDQEAEHYASMLTSRDV